jgi:hypothetical protein
MLVLISCNNGTKKSSVKSSDEISFLGIISEIPFLKLPYTINCDSCCIGIEDGLNNNIYNYIPESTRVIGKLRQTDLYVTLLLGVQIENILPTVTTFDCEGRVLDSNYFLSGWCGSDFNSYGNLNLEITDDFKIIERDTNYTFEMDYESGTIVDTISIETHISTFKIDLEGMIKEVK